MRWFQYSVDDFEGSYNPENCSLNVMERHENEHGEQWFEITNETKRRLTWIMCIKVLTKCMVGSIVFVRYCSLMLADKNSKTIQNVSVTTSPNENQIG